MSKSIKKKTVKKIAAKLTKKAVSKKKVKSVTKKVAKAGLKKSPSSKKSAKKGQWIAPGMDGTRFSGNRLEKNDTSGHLGKSRCGCGWHRLVSKRS